jgi:hypothetical protein
MRAWCVLLVLAACDNGLPLPSLVDNLRVLGVRSEPPEGPAGATVALDALVVTPDPTTPVEMAWIACVPVSAATGPAGCLTEAAPPLCSNEPEAPVCAIGFGPTVSYRLPARALGTSHHQVLITMVAAETDAGGLAGCLEGVQNGGVIPETCRVALKRVRVLPDGEVANRNPGITAVQVAGESVTVTLAPDAVEEEDELFFSWFTTVGELDSFRTEGDGLTNTWTPDESGRIWVVVRDGRGGESWATAER